MASIDRAKQAVLMNMAEKTAVFNPAELLILKELLDDCLASKDTSYKLLFSEKNGMIEGFTLFGRSPLTQNAWDVYWLIVDVACQRQGVGRRLLTKTEEAMSAENLGGSLVIRVETSSREEYAPARALYSTNGYAEVGRIAHFYKTNDALVTFTKVL